MGDKWRCQRLLLSSGTALGRSWMSNEPFIHSFDKLECQRRYRIDEMTRQNSVERHLPTNGAVPNRLRLRYWNKRRARRWSKQPFSIGLK